MDQPQYPTQSNWRRPIPGEDPAIARLTAMVAALTSELAIVRERLDTVERLSEAKSVFTRAEIEAYDPAPPVAAERDGLRQRLIAKVFRPLRDAAEQEARKAAKENAR